MSSPKPTHYRPFDSTEWIEWGPGSARLGAIRFDNGQIFDVWTGEWSAYVDPQEAILNEIITAMRLHWPINFTPTYVEGTLRTVLSRYDIKRKDGQ